jgi:hypothetical protein
MGSTLSDVLLERLGRETKPQDEWPALVLAALEGEASVDALLAASTKPMGKSAPAKSPAPADRQPSRVAYLNRLTVEGFRGIGRPATLDLVPGPGLTLVIGRNGSGKSSFAEALEQLLTGDTYRWRPPRAQQWRDGWRNLHHAKTAIRAEFALEGERAPCAVVSQWTDEADLDEADTTAQIHGKPRTGLDALGWQDALETYRPFLSYNELGSMLDEGPSKLYDALSAILGLDALVEAQAVLQKTRTSRDKALKDAKAARQKLLEALKPLEDERAQAVAGALERDDWGLDRIEQILAGSAAEAGEDSALRTLRELTAAPTPTNAPLAMDYAAPARLPDAKLPQPKPCGSRSPEVRVGSVAPVVRAIRSAAVCARSGRVRVIARGQIGRPACLHI